MFFKLDDILLLELITSCIEVLISTRVNRLILISRLLKGIDFLLILLLYETICTFRFVYVRNYKKHINVINDSLFNSKRIIIIIKLRHMTL